MLRRPEISDWGIKNERKEVKLSDIASALDVSVISVSNALNNRKGISEELRRKAKEKADELGYKLSATTDGKDLMAPTTHSSITGIKGDNKKVCGITKIKSKYCLRIKWFRRFDDCYYFQRY